MLSEGGARARKREAQVPICDYEHVHDLFNGETQHSFIGVNPRSSVVSSSFVSFVPNLDLVAVGIAYSKEREARSELAAL